MEIQIGNRTASSVDDIIPSIALLLWGIAGCGKTTLAATAPGKKLFVQFDQMGAISLKGRDDCIVLDLSAEKHNITAQMKTENFLGIEKALIDNPDILTVVFDSLTSYAILAMENAVAEVKSAVLENPGLKGYGHRNAIVLRVATLLLRICKRHNRHLILVSHEDSPTTDDNGVVQYISLALGGKQTNQIALALNEVWWMRDTGKEHWIAVRNCRTRQPMKTRMWDASTAPEFLWRYDVKEFKGDGIETWFNKWKESGCRKLQLPK